MLANDFDAEGNSLTAILVSGPSYAASFALNADGSFDYTPASGFSGTDSFTYRANDGSLNSLIVTVTLTITNGRTRHLKLGRRRTGLRKRLRAQSVIEQGGDATVVDNDSSDFDTGNLTVAITAGNVSAEDVLSVRHQGLGAGQIGFISGDVFFSGVQIGTAAGGSLGANLVITLNGSATPLAASALVQNIIYENIDAISPTTGPRTVRFTVDDGDGGVSADRDAMVFISGTNSAPVLGDTVVLLNPVNEDAGPPTGIVGTLVSDLVDLLPPVGGQDNVTDADATPLTGLAVTAADTTSGTWHFTTNGGASWNPLGAVSSSSARVLTAAPNTRLYFEPNPGLRGRLADGAHLPCMGSDGWKSKWYRGSRCQQRRRYLRFLQRYRYRSTHHYRSK